MDVAIPAKTAGHTLDPTDVRILNLLQRDARLEVNQIAHKVFKSPNATHRRIRRLRECGFIRRYTAVLDRKLIGRAILVVVLVRLKGHGSAASSTFRTGVCSFPEVEVCLQLSGEYDFLLQVSVRDTEALEQFLETRLCSLPVVEKVQSSLVLRECKNYCAYEL